MENKLPYYMTYPMPLVYDDERRERMDFEYMKSMYPDAAKKLLPYVEDECDRMEFEGSMIFDEYPDRLQLGLMGRRVMNRAEKDKVLSERETEGKKDKSGKWIQDLIQVMLYQEIYKRRCDHRKCSRKYFPGAEHAAVHSVHSNM